MEYDNNTPIYLQVIDQIKKDVLKGNLSPGQKLPSTRELALVYQINPNTAARVYTEMERIGLCFTRRGLGTFLFEDSSYLDQLRDEMVSEVVTKFIKETTQLGLNQGEIISRLEGEWKNVNL